MNVLVIGGTRFFGRHVVRKFLDRGDTVTVLTRGGSRPEFWDQVGHIAADRSNAADFEPKVRGRTFDIVVDNIAYSRADVESVTRALAGRIGHYLLCSSGSVYHDHDDLRQLRIISETDADLDFKGDLAYSEGKRAAEKALLDAASAPAARRLPFTIIRPPVVQGPLDPSGRAWYWIQRVADGREVLVPETVPSTVFSIAWSGDIAQAFVSAAGNSAAFGRTYNIGSAEIFSLEDYVRAIATTLAREPRLARVPLDVMRRHLDLDRFEPPLSDMRFVIDISAARQDLGFEPTPASEWIPSTVRWFLEEYGGPASDRYDQRDREVELAKQWMER